MKDVTRHRFLSRANWVGVELGDKLQRGDFSRN